MSNEVMIQQLKGGYVLTRRSGSAEREIITSTEELFQDLLQIFEGRGKYFGGDIFGKVTIDRDPKNSEV